MRRVTRNEFARIRSNLPLQLDYLTGHAGESIMGNKAEGKTLSKGRTCGPSAATTEEPLLLRPGRPSSPAGEAAHNRPVLSTVNAICSLADFLSRGK